MRSEDWSSSRVVVVETSGCQMKSHRLTTHGCLMAFNKAFCGWTIDSEPVTSHCPWVAHWWSKGSLWMCPGYLCSENWVKSLGYSECWLLVSTKKILLWSVRSSFNLLLTVSLIVYKRFLFLSWTRTPSRRISQITLRNLSLKMLILMCQTAVQVGMVEITFYRFQRKIKQWNQVSWKL